MEKRDIYYLDLNPDFIEMVIIVVLVHWVADFVLQPKGLAHNKSTSWEALTYHVVIYSTVWLAVGMFDSTFMVAEELKIPTMIAWSRFVVITFMAHFITDAITSRIVKKLWESGHTQHAMRVIGFDQVLHYVQIAVTLDYVT